MNDILSRRKFLAAGMVVPASAFAEYASLNVLTAKEGNTVAGVNAQGGLQYRILGKTGLKLSTVGFGCMITSDPSVIEKAVDLGINYFDTARSYQHGNNERMVGAALGNKRKYVMLSSKSEAEDQNSALGHLETSLHELRTDYLDIWFLHSKDEPASLNHGLLEAVQVAKKQGKARFVGISTHSAETMVPAALKAGVFDVVLITYNYTMGSRLDAVIDAANQANVGVVAMKVMAHGKKDLKPRVAPAALKWVLKNPKVHTTIPSMVDTDQLEQNFSVMASSFTEADQSLLDTFLRELAPVYCRMCGSCRGLCPRGLPVANLLRYLTYAEGYGQFDLGREKFLALPKQLRNVRCGDCLNCTIQCPNGVQISRRLSHAQHVFA
ncbi:MAG TPA: aldo/keto reductase [Terriglobia bacterium]|nr:aldo/keto reductase [Terriglobia bacterium]